MRHGSEFAAVFATLLFGLVPSVRSDPTQVPEASPVWNYQCPEPCYKLGPNPSNWTVFSDVKLIGGCARPVLLDFSLYSTSHNGIYVRSCDAWGAYYYFTPPAVISAAPDEEKTNVTAQLAWSPNPDASASSYTAITLLQELQYQVQRSTTPWEKTILFGAFQDVTVGIYIGDNMLNPGAVDTLFEPLIDKLFAVGIGSSKAAALQVCDEKRTSDLTFGVIVVANRNLAHVRGAVEIWSKSNCLNTTNTNFAESVKLENFPIRIKPRSVAPHVLPSGTPTTGLVIASRKNVLGAAQSRPGSPSGTGSAIKDGAQRGLTTLKTQPASKSTTIRNASHLLLPRGMTTSKPTGATDQASKQIGKMSTASPAQPSPTSQASNPTKDVTSDSIELKPMQSAMMSMGAFVSTKCRTLKVFAGDTCDSLAKSCQISRDDLIKFNPNLDLCKSTYEGQQLCCSFGTKPDVRPQPNADGSCFVHEVKAADSCESIAAAYGLKLEELESLNYDTWGWPGCKAIRNGIKICLSKGFPPMPAPISNAICGPQKPGTPVAKPGTDLTTLNPCPLNACCNSLGQCGVTEDFCISTQGSGSPGTGKNGTLSCISNCGMDVRTSQPPNEFIIMAYFDGSNMNRDCLNMDISQVDEMYTHIHFAFGLIGPDFGIDFKDKYSRQQFDQLTKLRDGPKRILSFGGWTYTPKSSFLPIFREGIKPENREKFASSISKFADSTGIDGVDFVWETPGTSMIQVARDPTVFVLPMPVETFPGAP
ncbi:hypothetical protein E4U21_006978 [Claviceps maximensis]|nr:hypothetical protein E4U21_006978 [Claviceps maximensis]